MNQIQQKIEEIGKKQRQAIRLRMSLAVSLRIEETWNRAFVNGACKMCTVPHAVALLNDRTFRPERYLKNGDGETFSLTHEQYEYIQKGKQQ